MYRTLTGCQLYNIVDVLDVHTWTLYYTHKNYIKGTYDSKVERDDDNNDHMPGDQGHSLIEP